MGVDVARVRLRVVLASALVVGASVAVAGPIGFVGLLVPHLIRLGVGAAHRALLPLAFLGGGLFLLVADVIARTLPAREIPVGVVTAAIGAPAFLILRFHEADGQISKLLRLREDRVVAFFQLDGSGAYLVLKRFSESAKALLALPELFFGSFASGDIAG